MRLRHPEMVSKDSHDLGAEACTKCVMTGASTQMQPNCRENRQERPAQLPKRSGFAFT